MENLLQAKIGKVYKIACFDSAPAKIRRRLLELGLTKGQKIVLSRKSVLGKAVLVDIRGYCLSLRSDVAKVVMVE